MTEAEMMQMLKDILPLLIPLAVVQVGLMVAALIHILTHTDYRVGNRAVWVIVSICINVIGPVLYFVFGRSESDGDDGGEDMEDYSGNGKEREP
jgi:heme/copper-type cytochrome/quinol oxidase subunit 4